MSKTLLAYHYKQNGNNVSKRIGGTGLTLKPNGRNMGQVACQNKSNSDFIQREQTPYRYFANCWALKMRDLTCSGYYQ